MLWGIDSELWKWLTEFKMPKIHACRQPRFPHIFLIIFLLAGLVTIVYLTQQKTNIFSKAFENTVPIPPPKPSPIARIPNMPSDLAGSCIGRHVSLHWKSTEIGDINYYIRYRKPDGGWWPSTASPLDGQTAGSGYEFTADQENQEFDLWGVIACNSIGCSDLAQGPRFSCSTDLSKAKRVFVTSTTHNGNLGGLDEADNKCQSAADGVGLGGIWKAWLSDSNVSAAGRLVHNEGPYIRFDNAVIANDWADLTDGSIQNPINVTEKNIAFPVERAEYVWVGTTTDGNIASIHCKVNKELCKIINLNCQDWHSLSYISSDWVQGSVGYAWQSNYRWSGGLDRVPYMICNTKLHLYCFEQ